jgi:hypothetical protein
MNSADRKTCLLSQAGGRKEFRGGGHEEARKYAKKEMDWLGFFL